MIGSVGWGEEGVSVDRSVLTGEVGEDLGKTEASSSSHTLCLKSLVASDMSLFAECVNTESRVAIKQWGPTSLGLTGNLFY